MPNPLVKPAAPTVTLQDYLVSASIREGTLFGIQPQLCLSLPLIRTVASKTSVGKNWTDVSIKIYGIVSR